MANVKKALVYLKNPRDYNAIKKLLLKRETSFSAWVRQKIREELDVAATTKQTPTN